jgi:hypothetical protein
VKSQSLDTRSLHNSEVFIAKVNLRFVVCSCDAVVRGKPAPSVESQNLDTRSLHNSEFLLPKLTCALLCAAAMLLCAANLLRVLKTRIWILEVYIIVSFYQGCGSGSGSGPVLDPYSIGSVDPDPDP